MDPKQEDMTSMNVSLPETLRDFITARARGRFGSASEYIRELVREDQRRAAQEKLEALLLEGLDSGEPVAMTEEVWEKLLQRARSRAATKKKGA